MKQRRQNPFASPSFDEGDQGKLPHPPRDGNRPEHVSCDMPISPNQVAALYDEEENIAGKEKESNNFKPVPVELAPPAPPSFFAEDDLWIITTPNPEAGAVARGRVEHITGDEEEDAPAPPHQFAEDIDWSNTGFEDDDWGDWGETSKQKSPFFSRHSSSKINKKIKSMSNQASATKASTSKASSTKTPSSKASAAAASTSKASPTTASITTASTATASITTASTAAATPPAFTMPLSNSSEAGEADNRSVGNTIPFQTRETVRSPSPPLEEAPLDRETSSSPVYHETEATVVQSVEATLIRDEPTRPIYDAIAIDNEDNDSQTWWKRYRKWVFLVSALFLIIGALVGAVVTMTLGAGLQRNGDVETPPQVNSPTPKNPSPSVPKRPFSSPPSADSTPDVATTTPTDVPTDAKDAILQTPSPASTPRKCSSGISEQSRNRKSLSYRIPLAGCVGYTQCGAFEEVDVTCPPGALYDVNSEICEDSNKVQCETAPAVSTSTQIPISDPTKEPTKATTPSPTMGEISTPIFLATPAATVKPTASPSLSPSTASPISSAPTTSPTLRPSTAKPSSLPTEHPMTGQPISPAPITPFPTTETSPVSTPATPRPTPLPTTLAPTTRKPSHKPTISPTTLAPTPKPTPLPTTLVPITKQPTPRPTPLPTTLAPTTRQPTPRPTPLPITSAPTKATIPPTSLAPVTAGKTSSLRIELQTDQHGLETSWTLYSVDAETREEITLIDENPPYSNHEKDSIELDLAPGKYNFTLRDSWGDGFCCSNGDGWYKIYLDNREIIRGDKYGSVISYEIVVGYDPDMKPRDTEWLEAHNSRRKIWHERHGETYIPLMWSKELAQGALSWAEELLLGCKQKLEPDIAEGENVAKNSATGEAGQGQLYPASSIVGRWVEQRETWGYPRNKQLTQVLWRASRYVGCADSVQKNDNGSMCHIQVCRYVRAGNCGMESYNASEGDNWLVPMLMEHTGCGPDCPPEGCY